MEWFGWLLIHYAASDVAVFGARPEYAAINLLGPLKTRPSVFRSIMQQACQAADELGTSIITGHTGTYKELSSIVGTCTAYGSIQRSKLITPAGAKPNDRILCIKPLGQETLTNFVLTHKRLAANLFDKETATLFARQVKMQTCVNEALILAQIGGVTAMHDVTEGGFAAALCEVADASKLGFAVDYAKLPITKELEILARHFKLSREQVMSVSSTGTLVAAVSPNAVSEIIQSLVRRGAVAAVVGVFKDSGERTLRYKGKTKKFPLKADDPYSKIMNA
jgi:hydrogenase maturation factor